MIGVGLLHKSTLQLMHWKTHLCVSIVTIVTVIWLHELSYIVNYFLWALLHWLTWYFAAVFRHFGDSCFFRVVSWQLRWLLHWYTRQRSSSLGILARWDPHHRKMCCKMSSRCRFFNMPFNEGHQARLQIEVYAQCYRNVSALVLGRYHFYMEVGTVYLW